MHHASRIRHRSSFKQQVQIMRDKACFMFIVHHSSFSPIKITKNTKISLSAHAMYLVQKCWPTNLFVSVSLISMLTHIIPLLLLMFSSTLTISWPYKYITRWRLGSRKQILEIFTIVKDEFRIIAN